MLLVLVAARRSLLGCLGGITELTWMAVWAMSIQVNSRFSSLDQRSLGRIGLMYPVSAVIVVVIVSPSHDSNFSLLQTERKQISTTILIKSELLFKIN